MVRVSNQTTQWTSWKQDMVSKMEQRLKQLPSLPKDYSEENQNIQQMLYFLRVIRKNKMEIPFDFESFYAFKLSERNCMRVIDIRNETEDLNNIEGISKALYQMQAINIEMIDSLKRVSGVKAEKETSSVSPILCQDAHLKKKKMVMSKLSRIRKRFYLTCDANTAMLYKKEVERAVRNFPMTTDEVNGWKKKLEQTLHDVKPPVDTEDSKDDENVNPIEDVCEEDAVCKDLAEKNNPPVTQEHGKWKNRMKQTTNAVLKITMDSANVKEYHEDTEVVVLEGDETETSNDNKETNLPQEILDIPDDCEENVVREENSNEELSLPNVPQEDPTEDDDQDKALYARLRILKQSRKKSKQRKEANYEPPYKSALLGIGESDPGTTTVQDPVSQQPDGGLRYTPWSGMCTEHCQDEPDCDLAPDSIELVTNEQDEFYDWLDNQIPATRSVTEQAGEPEVPPNIARTQSHQISPEHSHLARTRTEVPPNIARTQSHQISPEHSHLARTRTEVHKSTNEVEAMSIVSVPTYVLLMVLTLLIMKTGLVPGTDSKTAKRKFKETKNCGDECCYYPNLRKLLALRSYLYVILGTLRMLISQTKRKAIRWTIEKLKLYV